MPRRRAPDGPGLIPARRSGGGRVVAARIGASEQRQAERDDGQENGPVGF